MTRDSSHRTVTTPDRLALAVYESGRAGAPVVVAVHGYPDDHAVWDGVAADLGADHRVVTYDVRGAGASGAPATRAGYRLDRLTDDLVAVLDAVAPAEPIHLLAHDWGSIQAWHAVTDARTAGRVASFTSISGPCLDHVAHWFRRRGRHARREIRRQALASWYTLAFRAPWLPERLWRSAGFRARIARREDMPVPAARDAVNGLELYRANIAVRMAAPEVRRADLPVLVLAPDRDPFVTPALARCAEPFVPDLRVQAIPGRHWVVRHDPGLVAGHVRELVARSSARRP